MTPPPDPDSLAVWCEDRRVGVLVRDRQDRIGFRYDEGWLEEGFAIGRVLPLQAEAFGTDEGRAHAWFANLLPEGGARERIVRNLGIADDDFSLLRAIGGDCAGALSLIPVDQAPDNDSGAHPLSDAALERLLAQRGQGNLLRRDDDRPRPRLSLAGAQSKCPVLIEGDRFLLPIGATPSTHILKFELPQWRNVPVYELFLARLAAAVGLPVPEVAMQRRGEHRFLVVTRYDRERLDDRCRRLHQEDFCQIAGQRPTRKYESEGGPGLAAAAGWIRDLSARPAEDLLLLVRWQAFKEPLNNSVRSAFQSEKPQIDWCDPSDSSRRYGRGAHRSRCDFSGETLMGRAFPGHPLRFGSLIWNNQTTLAEATASHPGKTPARPHRVFQRLLNWLAGNADGHAKNLSLVRDDDGAWRLAPFYDLVCTRAWPDLDRRLAMGVGGEADPGRIDRRQWEQAATDLGMRAPFILNEVGRLAGAIEDVLPGVIENLQAQHGPLPMLQQPETVVRTQLRLARTAIA